ncbi:MAG: transcription termination/antitermination NusG family protein [Verrucomicrobiota bacterium]
MILPLLEDRKEGDNAQWLCLQSQPKHEMISVACMAKQYGVENFLPKIRFKKLVRSKVVWVTEPLFPRYFFARVTPEMIPMIRSAHGVSSVLRFGGKYAVVDESIICELKHYTVDNEVIEVEDILGEGDQVVVTEGPFHGVSALVKQVMPAKDRVKILIDLLGQKTEVLVKRSALLRDVAHPLAD